MRILETHYITYMRFRLIVLLSVAVVAPSADLFKDDFSRLPPRVFSEPIKQLTNAIQEYHYLPHRGVSILPWENAIAHTDVWTGGDEDGKAYVEMHEVNPTRKTMNPTLVTGDIDWFDYTLETKVRPLSNSDMAGIAFRYRTNRHYYLFALTGGNRAVLRLRLPEEKKFQIAEWKDLGSADFAYDTKRYYTLKVENSGPKMRAYIDGKLVLEASDSEILKGRVGVTANIPARFTDVRVSASADVERGIKQRVANTRSGTFESARFQSEAQNLEEVRYARLRRRTQRSFRRS